MRAILDLTDRPDVRHIAMLWFASDRHEPGSFLWICDQLKLDASLLRRWAIEMADDNALKERRWLALAWQGR